MWADRILNSAIALQLLNSEQATEADLKQISQGWNDWSADDDGWLSILHSEVICRIK